MLPKIDELLVSGQYGDSFIRMGVSRASGYEYLRKSVLDSRTGEKTEWTFRRYCELPPVLLPIGFLGQVLDEAIEYFKRRRDVKIYSNFMREVEILRNRQMTA